MILAITLLAWEGIFTLGKGLSSFQELSAFQESCRMLMFTFSIGLSLILEIHLIRLGFKLAK